MSKHRYSYTIDTIVPTRLLRKITRKNPSTVTRTCHGAAELLLFNFFLVRFCLRSVPIAEGNKRVHANQSRIPIQQLNCTVYVRLYPLSYNGSKLSGTGVISLGCGVLTLKHSSFLAVMPT